MTGKEPRDGALSSLSGATSWETSLGGLRVVFGAGALSRLGGLVRDLGAGRVLLVTDHGVRNAGHVERAHASLKEAGLEARLFDGVEENPTSAHVEAGVALAREARTDVLVGLGGGSAMDCAKGINLLLTNGGRMEDYRGFRRATRPLLPSLGVPTTAGTGSEAQSYALIADERTHEKMACGDPGARFRAVILDPEVAATVPRPVAATSGLDAVTHAVESYVSTRSHPVSRMYAREAWRLLDETLESVLDHTATGEAWGRVLLGAHLAGLSIENSMLGAAHACANPLTARFGIPHGKAVGMMLPPTMRFNAPAVDGLYRELHRASSAAAGSPTLVDRVERLLRVAGPPGSLREWQVPRGSLAELAAEAAEQWTATFNPRPVTEADLRQFYEAAY